MDDEGLAELTSEVFLLRQQIEAYSRLQAAEIDELRSKLREIERRLSKEALHVSHRAVIIGSGNEDDECVSSL